MAEALSDASYAMALYGSGHRRLMDAASGRQSAVTSTLTFRANATVEPTFLLLLGDITPAFAPRDAIVTSVSNQGAGFG
jgi:hypothetical protein